MCNCVGDGTNSDITWTAQAARLIQSLDDGGYAMGDGRSFDLPNMHALLTLKSALEFAVAGRYVPQIAWPTVGIGTGGVGPTLKASPAGFNASVNALINAMDQEWLDPCLGHIPGANWLNSAVTPPEALAVADELYGRVKSLLDC